MEATLVVISAHTTPGGRVRLRLSDGTTARAARGSRLAARRKGDVLDADDLAVLAGHGDRARWREDPPADPVEDALDRILDLHHVVLPAHVCAECSKPWPCPTWDLARLRGF